MRAWSKKASDWTIVVFILLGVVLIVSDLVGASLGEKRNRSEFPSNPSINCDDDPEGGYFPRC